MHQAHQTTSRIVRVRHLAELLRQDPSGETAVKYLNTLPLMPRDADELFREAEKRAYWRKGER